MVRAIEEERETYKSRIGHFKELNANGKRRTRSLLPDMSSNCLIASPEDNRAMARNQASASLENQGMMEKENVKSRLANDGAVQSSRDYKQQHSDMEMMKERFAKLLLGEDMSGGGKGVSSALALSNAITNLAASVFGEQKRLEPMSPDRKARWKKEIDWLLSVTDHIVEFVPSKQTSKDGINMEIMVTRQRNDLHMSIPALRKLDAILIDCLENFKDQNELYYVSNDEEGQRGTPKRKDDKWWIPVPKVPPHGLSDDMKKWLQFQKDSVNQVHKAAMAINSQVLAEMEVPESYIETLPKNGRACLGDVIYRSIRDEEFGPDEFLSTMDLLSDHTILDLKNKIEASVVIWKRKMTAKDGKSAWGSAVSMEKRERFEERAETILIILKQRYPGIPQSQLDISKIQFNRDVGQAILESYSRAIETLAFTVLSRIEDVLQADSVARSPTSAEQKRFFCKDEEKLHPSRTLLDFMGWNLDQVVDETEKDFKEELPKDADLNLLNKPPNIFTNKRMSYLENLGAARSPTART